LLPVLQVQYILSQLTKSEVRRSLQSDLSATLAEVFQSTIDRIKSLPSDQRHAMNRQSLAKNTLMWISYAKRVLTVGELQHALAVRLTDSDLDRDNFVDVRLIVDSCFGLVEIDRESSTIRFVHFSLQEFLKTHRHGLFGNGDLDVTKVCLRYMSLDSVKSLHSKNRTQFTKDLADLAFLDYAAAKWGFHAANVAPCDVWDLAQQFLGSRPHLLAVARVRDQSSPYFRKWHERMHEWVDSGGADISLCANFGLTEFVRTLIGQNTQPMLKARNMYGSTALHEAALQGFESTVEILLDRGADVLDVNTGKSTPLYLAVANNKIAMARLLLRQETDEQLAVAGKQGWTVLHKATDMGNEEMVTLLLQYGAQVNTEDERGMRPLHLATREGHLNIVRLLLLSCAEVYCTDLEGLTPLDLAVTNGHVEVSKLLLDNGAPVEHRGLDSWSALQRATRGGHEEVVALLLQCGANILTRDHRGQIPLHAAARSGNARVVALLLQTQPDLRKAQLWKRERKGSTPRDVAFFTAHFDIYKQLRAAEMELQNYCTVTGASKMAFAIESGKREKVRRLIADKPNEIDVIIEGRQPALHLALQEQQHDIVRLLLDHGANINSIGYHGWTPLHITAAIGDLTLTNLCLSQGAHVAARTNTQQTVLHKACSSGNPKVAQVLLDAGADKEAENERGMRPLHVASRHNDLVTAQLLVMEYGVDVNAVTRFGESAADWAERSGNLELLRFLRREKKKLRQADEGVRGF
jgi:ankyrin repeat protein